MGRVKDILIGLEELADAIDRNRESAEEASRCELFNDKEKVRLRVAVNYLRFAHKHISKIGG